VRNHPITFHIRFTEKEYERLCKYAEKSGLPKTTYIRHMINGNQPREKPPAEYWKFMQQIYDMGTSFDRLRDMARMQGWIQSASLEETEKSFNRLILQITDAIIMPEKVDVKETLERDRQVAEQDIWEGR
jgi:hypothetical protein